MTDNRFYAMGLVAAFAVACSPAGSAGTEGAAASAPTPAVVPAATASATTAAASAPSADSARVWVVRLYDRYRDDSFSPFGAAKPEVFGPEIIHELAENDRLTPEGEMGAIDADPICSCQDPTDMQATVGEVSIQGADRAVAKVKLQWPLPPDPIPSQIPDYTQNVTLQLQMTPAGWRVRDIGGDEARDSFLAYLREENRNRRAGR